MTEPVTHKLEVPGAVLCYDVRQSEPAGGQVLVLIGSPMGAAGFATLASHFTDRTVVTYDPRGVERSERTDADLEVTPEVHAADVRAVIAAVGGGPVDLFASSGGAVNALALVAAHPYLVRTLVAHEPPSASVLPDATEALAACRAVQDTYHRSGWGAGMAHFLSLVTLRGPVPPGWATQPPPDPAMFGMPAEDDGNRDDLMLGSNMVTVTHDRPDIDALLKAPTRIVVAVGAESEGELAHRGGLAVAELLGATPTTFPSHHGGFLGGEYGQSGEPEAFAERLREVRKAHRSPSRTEEAASAWAEAARVCWTAPAWSARERDRLVSTPRRRRPPSPPASRRSTTTGSTPSSSRRSRSRSGRSCATGPASRSTSPC